MSLIHSACNNSVKLSFQGSSPAVADRPSDLGQDLSLKFPILSVIPIRNEIIEVKNTSNSNFEDKLVRIALA